jgi:CheY-like chemotaxis protein
VKSILLAEDAVTVRDLAKNILEEYGYNVIVVGNGVDATLRRTQHIPILPSTPRCHHAWQKRERDVCRDKSARLPEGVSGTVYSATLHQKPCVTYGSIIGSQLKLRIAVWTVLMSP